MSTRSPPTGSMSTSWPACSSRLAAPRQARIARAEHRARLDRQLGLRGGPLDRLHGLELPLRVRHRGVRAGEQANPGRQAVRVIECALRPPGRVPHPPCRRPRVGHLLQVPFRTVPRGVHPGNHHLFRLLGRRLAVCGPHRIPDGAFRVHSLRGGRLGPCRARSGRFSPCLPHLIRRSCV